MNTVRCDIQLGLLTCETRWVLVRLQVPRTSARSCSHPSPHQTTPSSLPTAQQPTNTEYPIVRDKTLQARTLTGLYSITPLHFPEISPKSTLAVVFLIFPAIWLYDPEKYPFVLNCISALKPRRSFLAVQVSPSSNTIFPQSIPRAYMFGMEITYSAKGIDRHETATVTINE